MQKILGTAFRIGNLERAIEFYTTVLPFTHEKTYSLEGAPYDQLTGLEDVLMRKARLSVGAQHIELVEVQSHLGRPIPIDSQSNDRWFQHVAIVVSDMDAAYAHLREHRVQHVSSMPQTLPEYIEGAAGIRAFYFRDADGHNLELIWFPEGKGNPKWQTMDGLFIGIDHTAIGIADTPRSLGFYRDKLRLTVAGESENYGPEQERLNMVFGAHLQITGLQAADGGIGLEFLEYLSPPGGRAMPADTSIADLWYWETVIVADDFDGVIANRQHEIVSPVVEFERNNRAVMLRDPDGHFIRMLEDEPSEIEE